MECPQTRISLKPACSTLGFFLWEQSIKLWRLSVLETVDNSSSWQQFKMKPQIQSYLLLLVAILLVKAQTPSELSYEDVLSGLFARGDADGRTFRPLIEELQEDTVSTVTEEIWHTQKSNTTVKKCFFLWLSSLCIIQSFFCRVFPVELCREKAEFRCKGDCVQWGTGAARHAMPSEA